MFNAINDLNVKKVKNLTKKYKFTTIKDEHILVFLLRTIDENTNNENFNQIFDILYENLQYNVKNINIKTSFNICFSHKGKYDTEYEETHKFKTLIHSIKPQTINFLNLLLQIKTNILVEWNRSTIPDIMYFTKNKIICIKAFQYDNSGLTINSFNNIKNRFAENHVLPKINHMIEEIEKKTIDSTNNYSSELPPKYEDLNVIDD